MNSRRMFGENILRFVTFYNGWRACERIHGRATKRRGDRSRTKWIKTVESCKKT